VIGSDFGADGYTTVEQADELARRLELRPGLRLLDLGCGSGWPGLYLAMRTGCQVVLSDVPLDGLRSAKARAVRERLSELDEVDVTAAYRDTARAWLRHRQEFEAGLAALEPPGAFAAKLARRRAAIALIEAGHLRRSLLLATRPSRRARREGRLATAAHEIDPGAVTPHR
jgi:SAM-dependent methyltransferase